MNINFTYLCFKYIIRATKRQELYFMPRKSIVSVEFKVNLLRPVGGKKVVATGRVIKPGKTLMIAEAEVVDDDTGKLVAKMLGTMMVAKGEA